MSYKIKTEPATEPVTLAEMQAHLRLSAGIDEATITALITSARKHAEDYTGRQLITASWYLYLDQFPSWEIDITKLPFNSVTSLAYKDSDGEDTELTVDEDFVIDASFGRITPAYGETWPSTYDQLNAITIEFVAGYGAAAAVPKPIWAAIVMMVAHLYENKGDEGHRTIPKTVYMLLDPYVIHKS